MQKELDLVDRELRIYGYSPKTIKSYLHGLKEYFDYTLTKKSIFFAFLFILGVWGFSWFLSLQQIL